MSSLRSPDVIAVRRTPLRPLLAKELRGILGGRALWFHRRVLQDEERLKGIFGVEYAQYLVKVKRWIPGVL